MKALLLLLLLAAGMIGIEKNTNNAQEKKEALHTARIERQTVRHCLEDAKMRLAELRGSLMTQRRGALRIWWQILELQRNIKQMEDSMAAYELLVYELLPKKK